MLQKFKNYYHLVRAIIALFYFGYPARKLKVIGVTGTDGKTTTVHMISHILEKSGKKVGYVSSIEAHIGDQKADTGFHVTTPDPWRVQKLLKKMVDFGTEYAVLEVTSHGLDQNRVFGCNFSVGVLTNISHEHLDYHKTFENYVRSKSKLFKKAKISVLNVDDPNCNKILKIAKGKIITYGIKNSADYNIQNVQVKLRISGQYNLYNALAAAAAASVLGIKKEVILNSLTSFNSLQGRMEEIDEGQDFQVVVDFAHTPRALEEALTTLREMAKGKVIAVFGAAGERDYQKRSQMGQLAAKLADLSVITAEDPRRENIVDITKQIVKGFQKETALEGKDYFIVPDRKYAIEFALLKLAKKGDVVGVFGKGHEKSMCFGKIERPWSDQNEVRKALNKIRYE
jgi:UDP-N-acetylmuramoyl-L-alanyl-D-glutamate--2,6-diaminopimelate ligase